MKLRQQDILILMKLVALAGKEWSYAELAKALGMGVGEVHRGLARAQECRLVDFDKKRPVYAALREFLIHGIRYCCPPELGAQTRGIPTGHAAPFLTDKFLQGNEPPPVWPHPEGNVRGASFSPLYRSAPDAALKDEDLYFLLVLVDMLRGGNARERKWAADALEKKMSDSE